jgi:hypothetical protein
VPRVRDKKSGKGRCYVEMKVNRHLDALYLPVLYLDSTPKPYDMMRTSLSKDLPMEEILSS